MRDMIEGPAHAVGFRGRAEFSDSTSRCLGSFDLVVNCSFTPQSTVSFGRGCCAGPSGSFREGRDRWM